MRIGNAGMGGSICLIFPRLKNGMELNSIRDKCMNDSLSQLADRVSKQSVYLKVFALYKYDIRFQL